MYNLLLMTLCSFLAVGSTANAFVFRNTIKISEGASFSLSSSSNDNSEIPEPTVSQSSYNKNTMSAALPFLKCPLILAQNMDVPGNVGFDPFGFVRDKDDLIEYQEAEVKHARLAMLVCLLLSSFKENGTRFDSLNEILYFASFLHLKAAVGWPLSELWNGKIADLWNLPTILASDDRVPAILNSNLGSVSPIFWGFCLGASAAIDTHAILKSRNGSDLTYFPGNLGFDPLGIFPADKEGQLRMRLAEIKHGRLAMIAISGFALQEFVTKVGVVDQTPLFFHPLTLMN